MTLHYSVRAQRHDSHAALARCKEAELVMDTDPAGRKDAFNPAELLLAAVAACMLKNLERVAPILSFRFSGAEVRLSGVREDRPPRIVRIDYEMLIETDETDRRLALMHENIRKFGTISNTVAGAVDLQGVLRRAPSAAASALVD
ncbi:MAG: OsmC family protein [Rhodospirillales bacterium]|nr:OsmC family protein [Rhodospirillales bacterium]